MVSFSVAMNVPVEDFQYSLCRVVLMVQAHADGGDKEKALSVLALSSRFDGHTARHCFNFWLFSFSTRSVESF